MITNSQSLNGLQFLRFIAIFLVILAHIPIPNASLDSLIFSNGAIGVDIFFVISGFIMMYITVNKSNAFEFFSKRFLRIAPLNTFFIIITLLICYLLLMNPEYYANADFAYQYPASKLDIIYFFKSIFFIHGYTPPINGIAWSLQYEFIFYTLFSVCLLISVNKFIFFTIYGLIIIVVNYYNYGFLTDKSLFSLFFDPLMLEFILGTYLFKIYLNKNKHKKL